MLVEEEVEMIEVPEGYIRKRSSTIPFGYELDNNTKGFLKPIPEQLDILKEVSKAVHNQEISLGVGVDWLEAETNRTMSRMGLKKYVDKKYKKLNSLLDKT
jgi:hypothetical protein